MAWATTDDIKGVLRGILAKASINDLPSRWTPIIDQASLQSKVDIETTLISRGYTPSQVQGWTYCATFHIRQAVYWALVFGAALHPYEDRFIEKLDMRETLETVTLTDGDDVLTPGLLGTIAQTGDLLWDGLGLNFAPEDQYTIKTGMRDIGEREY